MQVKATQNGYYGHRRRKEGEVFNLSKKEHFSSKWMVEYTKKAKPSKVQQVQEEDSESEGGEQNSQDDEVI